MKVIGTAEATAVIADYFDLICDTDYAFDESEILRRMNANAVDAEPVRHGKWIHKGGGVFICDKCNWHIGLNVYTGEKASESFRFCPHCGARMDKE